MLPRFCVDNLAVPCENISSGICGQRRPRSACVCPDDTLRMRRMARICAFCACSKARFRWGGPIDAASLPEAVSYNKSIWLPGDTSGTARWVVNSVDSDQAFVFHHCLHCLLLSVRIPRMNTVNVKSTLIIFMGNVDRDQFGISRSLIGTSLLAYRIIRSCRIY